MTIALSELAGALAAPYLGTDVPVCGIAVDSRQVRPGDLFVVQRGTRAHGSRFLADARAAGAVAACAARPVDGLPTIVVADPRAATAALAAALYRHPARQLSLIGVTGTLGKTSTALLVESALAASGFRVGVIGSLGVRVGGTVMDTGMTTPDAPAIHSALRGMVGAGVTTALLEVTSHGIALGRVAGLRFALGVVTNLVPDEHLEFHPSPAHYLRTKSRFFGMLEDGAPLIFNYDDERVRARAAAAWRRRRLPVLGVSADGAEQAPVRVMGLRRDSAGSAFALEIRDALPRLGGGTVEPGSVPLVLPVVGTHPVANAALAATAALVAGASSTGITEALAEQEPIRRRMEIVRRAAPVILDDTVGNPRTLLAVFESIRAIPHGGLRIAFGIRGSRGTRINRRLAAALAAALRDGRGERPPCLVLTASEDAAGPRDRVLDAERDAMLDPLRRAGVEFAYEPTVARAVRRVLEGWAPDDLVLLLGAQGMDRAAELARAMLPAE